MASIASKGTPVEGTPVKGTKVKGTKVAEASDDDDSSVTSDGSEKSKETVEKDAKKWRRHLKIMEAAKKKADIDVRKTATL
jgi:hypothetical protein